MFEKVKTFLIFLVAAVIIVGVGTFLIVFVYHDLKMYLFKPVPKEEFEIVEEGKPFEKEAVPKKEFGKFKVDTDDGVIEGEERKYKYSTRNDTYYAFQGIPYAKPPMGELRFQEPQPVVPWENVFDATKERNICPQKLIPGRLQSEVIGSEDCLYLNVYTPKRPDKIVTLKPVMVWFHGGGFQFGSGSSDLYGPDFLVKNDVILVTFNYRLGALGFLNLQVDKAPGNVGLKDQLAVLKWIKSNISHFGGDPNNITLFGEDSGAASIQIFTISPDIINRDLFHKVILQSGSIMNPWAMSDDEEETSHALAEKLGIKTLAKDYDKIIEDLCNMPVEDIINAQDEIVTIHDIENLELFAFVPSVEDFRNNSDVTRLVADNPYLAFASGHLPDIPLIAGINNGEANSAFLYYSELMTPEMMESLNNVPDILIPTIIQQFDNPILKGIAKNVVKKFYFRDDHITWENLPDFLKLLSDGFVGIGMYMTIELMKQTPSPLYVYEFGFKGDLNYAGNKAEQVFNLVNEDFSKRYSRKPEDEEESTGDTPNNSNSSIDFSKIKLSGASHQDALGYLFLMNKYDKEISKEKYEYNLREQLTLMWTNFAKNTNPNGENVNIEWPNCDDKEPAYLNIGDKFEVIPTDVEKRSYSFWKTLFVAVFQGNPSIIIDYLQGNKII